MSASCEVAGEFDATGMLLSSKTHNAPLVTQLTECLTEGLGHVQAELTRLAKIAESQYPPIQKVTPCNRMGHVRHTSHYKDTDAKGRHISWGQSWQLAVKTAREVADAFLAESEAIHAQNVEAIASNRVLRENLSRLMRSIGVAETYSKSEYLTKRSSKPTSLTHSAGFVQDMSRLIIVEDGYSSLKSDYERIIRNIDDYAREREREDNTAKAAAENETKKKDRERAIGALAGALGLNGDAERDDIEEAVLAKDKYLRLGHFLQLNRNNWRDGPDRASTGLDGFTVETSEDREIVANLQPLIEDWGGDGRVFRDCEWNYDRLFGKVPVDVMALYARMAELFPDA